MQDDDIYQDIINGLDYLVDRVVMKRAVLSILYGMSEEQTKIGELSEERVKDIRRRVFEYFKIDELLNLALKKSRCGYYQTFFGRPIHWDKDVQLHQVLNGYIQGTAVDVALSGFLNLIERFDEEMVPVGLIHDAMLIDVSKKNKNKFVKLIEEGYNCKDLGRFTFSIETISQRKI
jgi:DNA polymerase I-like protein with 3'-5' exonuclease and polymerase domains